MRQEYMSICFGDRQYADIKHENPQKRDKWALRNNKTCIHSCVWCIHDPSQCKE